MTRRFRHHALDGMAMMPSTKKDRPVYTGTALTVSRDERRTATYSIYVAARPRLAERRSGAEDSPSSPGLTSPTYLVSSSAGLTPRTRPCLERGGGPRVAHTRHQGPYPRVMHTADARATGISALWLGRSAPASAQGQGIV